MSITSNLTIECAQGRARLRGAIGTDAPRWWYHVGCAVHAAPELKLMHRQRTLLLGNDLTGAAELDAFELDAGASPRAACDALIATALEAVRAAPERWGRTLIVELPGVRDAHGRSPFWQGLGRHFHAGDIDAEAERLGAEVWRRHVAALLPRQVLYTSFLSAEAQAAIGGVREDARPLREALEAVGFGFAGEVKIDDGGAVMALAVAQR
jgi:arginine N-succinyltransferase